MPAKQVNPEFLLILDYNLSRTRDVAAMRDYARTRYGLRTLLIRARPQSIDRSISDVVIDLDPHASTFVASALEALAPFRSAIAAGLVFSDKAVHQGALLLDALGLPVDNPALAQAALNKEIYRRAEQRYQDILAPQGLFMPACRRITTLAELVQFTNSQSDGFVIKPACEGNNRGVIMLRQGDDLPAALEEVSRYLPDGVICEQRIPFNREFSFDGLSALNFITEKLSAGGRYPVEEGQFVPATVTAAEARLIRRAGSLANVLVGQCDGPFHNEIKVSDDGKRAAVVEPNRRPAGMKIWSLARRVYGIDFFQLWVDQALGQPVPDSLPPPHGHAATLMLGVPFDCAHLQADGSLGERLLAQQVMPALRQRGVLPTDARLDLFDFVWLHDSDRPVRAVPRDNGDFVAHVCIYSPTQDLDMRTLVAQTQAEWRRALAAYLGRAEPTQSLRATAAVTAYPA